jgi:LytS/YehU family sensor histidine kinase
MNPHFIFNSLNSIQYFILKKQPQEAYTYLSKFASLMRKILQNSRLKYISITDEIEWLELYLEMEKLRMDNRLDYRFDTSGVKDPDKAMIPTMLIQSYVENSIIHGLLSKEDDRRITIAFSLRGKHVECAVEDNGIGRKASRVMNEKRTRKHQSAGMDLTRKRLEILSEGKGEFDVQIEDLEQDGKAKGTRVRILIPLIAEDE